MLKPTVKRGLMLDFIPDEIICPAEIDKNRVFKLNDKPIRSGKIVYIMSRELRVKDNWGLLFARELAKKYNRKLKIFIYLDENSYSKHQIGFLLEGLNFLRKNLALNDLDYEVCEKLPTNAGAFVVDFNPIEHQTRGLNPLFEKKAKQLAKSANCAVFEVDSHNIIPARFVSNKQEYSAATLRRKIYAHIAGFLTEFPNHYTEITGKAQTILNEFIQEKLDLYAEYKNDPNKNLTSSLSPFLRFGFISAQRIALEVLKSSATRENKEAFLEELIVRKELAENFCLYHNKYKSLEGVYPWAKDSLNAHKTDMRNYVYSQYEFEMASTHDKLWNAIQTNLLKTGKIHGYLRMYWAKKILEWSISPEEALKIAIYLNDTYALDGIAPNGYVGVLWSIAGIHDRAFANRMVTGKIRYMSLDGCKKKFNVKEYISSSK